MTQEGVFRFVFKSEICSNEAENIIGNKENNTDNINNCKEKEILFEEERKDTESDGAKHSNIIGATDYIVTFERFNNFKNTFTPVIFGCFAGFFGLSIFHVYIIN